MEIREMKKRMGIGEGTIVVEIRQSPQGETELTKNIGLITGRGRSKGKWRVYFHLSGWEREPVDEKKLTPLLQVRREEYETFPPQEVLRMYLPKVVPELRKKIAYFQRKFQRKLEESRALEEEGIIVSAERLQELAEIKTPEVNKTDKDEGLRKEIQKLAADIEKEGIIIGIRGLKEMVRE